MRFLLLACLCLTLWGQTKSPLQPKDYGRWLSCPVDEAPSFFAQWQGRLDAVEAPLPPRAPRSSSVRTSRPAQNEGPGLF